MQQNQFKEKKGCVTVVLLVGGLCPFKVAGLATPLICSYCISYISVCQTCFHLWSCAKIKKKNTYFQQSECLIKYQCYSLGTAAVFFNLTANSNGPYHCMKTFCSSRLRNVDFHLLTVATVTRGILINVGFVLRHGAWA